MESTFTVIDDDDDSSIEVISQPRRRRRRRRRSVALEMVDLCKEETSNSDIDDEKVVHSNAVAATIAGKRVYGRGLKKESVLSTQVKKMKTEEPTRFKERRKPKVEAPSVQSMLIKQEPTEIDDGSDKLGTSTTASVTTEETTRLQGTSVPMTHSVNLSVDEISTEGTDLSPPEAESPPKCSATRLSAGADLDSTPTHNAQDNSRAQVSPEMLLPAEGSKDDDISESVNAILPIAAALHTAGNDATADGAQDAMRLQQEAENLSLNMDLNFDGPLYPTDMSIDESFGSYPPIPAEGDDRVSQNVPAAVIITGNSSTVNNCTTKVIDLIDSDDETEGIGEEIGASPYNLRRSRSVSKHLEADRSRTPSKHTGKSYISTKAAMDLMRSSTTERQIEACCRQRIARKTKQAQSLNQSRAMQRRANAKATEEQMTSDENLVPKSAFDSRKERDKRLQLGDLVYCLYCKPAGWFWGVIVEKNGSRPGSYTYRIDYADGDHSINVKADVDCMIDYDEYQEKETSKKHPEYAPTTGDIKFWKKTKVDLLNGNIPSTELDFGGGRKSKLPAPKAKITSAVTRKCGICQKCRQKECESCMRCSKKEFSKKRVLGVCFHKTCLQIPVADKAEPCSQLPAGWRFCFHKECRENEYGLLFVSPCEQTGTFSWHVSQGRSELTELQNNLTFFRQYAGLPDNFELGNRQPTSVGRLFEERCTKCFNCRRQSCKTCELCLSEECQENLCYRKICLKADLKYRKQKATHFPTGWFFYFDDTAKMDGLVLLSPSNKRYTTVDEAVKDNVQSFRDLAISPDLFYDTVGLQDYSSKGSGTEEHRHSKSSRTLFWTRCRSCVYCKAPDCGKCIKCKNNDQFSRPWREVCVRKVCIHAADARLQQIQGFQPGWLFKFDHWNPSALELLPTLKNLQVYAPSGKRYNSIRTWKASASIPPAYCAAFYDQIGEEMTIQNEHHVLLNRPYMQKWVNVDYANRVMHGTVVSAMTNRFLEVTEFKIECCMESRKAANSGRSVVEQVPEEFDVSERAAIGGCLNMNRDLYEGKKPSHFDWWVGEEYIARMVGDSQGKMRPHLTVTLETHALLFNVRESTIPGAGLGVFVSCVGFSGYEDSHYTLDVGRFLDLGIYAPIIPGDVKDENIITVKNFIYDGKVDTYAFDCDKEGNCFDITEDTTGELHAKASERIHPFVNEVAGNGQQKVNVHAVSDPVGGLHYLLGHDSEVGVPFTLNADGSEIEIFVDYGQTYEQVRVREGYPRVTGDELAKLQSAVEGNYSQTLNDMSEKFTANEVKICLDFFKQTLPKFQCDTKEGKSVVVRSTMLAIVLLSRLRKIRKDFPEDKELDPSEVCDNGALSLDLNTEVENGKKIILALFGKYRSAKKLQEAFLRDTYFMDYLKNCRIDVDLERMSPDDFKKRMQFF